MSAVLRTLTCHRNHGICSWRTRMHCIKSLFSILYSETYPAGFTKFQETSLDGLPYTSRFYHIPSIGMESCSKFCLYSSQAGNIENNQSVDDGFSELENDLVNEDSSEEDIGNGLISDEEDFLGDTKIATDVGKTSVPPEVHSTLVKAILESRNLSMKKIIEKWIEEGNELTHKEVSLTILELRKRRRMSRALQLLECLDSSDHVDLLANSYASRVDLLAKIRGLGEAENYINQLPEPFRDERVYRTLLANYVSASNLTKAEEVFNKMKDLGLPISSFTCCQLLLLYKRTDKRKIADVLQFMVKEDIKPSQFFYKVLIDIKGQSYDSSGMKRVVEIMKKNGMKPNEELLTSLVRYCIAAGLEDEADSLLKELEGNDLNGNRRICRLLLPIYALLGRENEVARIWEVCESDADWEECMAAIEAWGRLKKIENAEAAFEKIEQNIKKPSSKHFTALLKVYAYNKMLTKGRDLVKRLKESGCKTSPLAWDGLVKFYVEVGEMEKAEAILSSRELKWAKPMFTSYFTIMDQYAKNGDVYNAEKWFFRMRKDGIALRLVSYRALLKAYVNSKSPVYGFIDRMKGDNVVPSKALFDQVARIDPFKKSVIAELLE